MIHRRLRLVAHLRVHVLLLLLLIARSAAAAELYPEVERGCGSAAALRRHRLTGPLPVVQQNISSTLAPRHRGSFLPIRIVVFTEDVRNPSRVCNQAGEYCSDFQGGAVQCKETDVLTPEKKALLLNKILPEAVKLHSDRLSVQRYRSKFVVPGYYYTNPICNEFSVPFEHRNHGVENYDFVLYVSAAPTSDDVISWATTCATNYVSRPLVGMINIAPKYIADDSRMIRSVAHEIAHALGFNIYFFDAAFLVSLSTARGKPRSMQMTSPTVVAVGREHFGWQGLQGVELEDEGGAGTAYSHWKRRNLKDELMAGIQSIGYYTAFTLAAFEDLGYYQADFSKAETMPWGYKAGETFLTEKCVKDGVSQYPDMFCTEQSLTLTCSDDRRSLGFCGLGVTPDPMPPYYQYFKDPTVVGISNLMDYCPIVLGYSNTECWKGNSAVMPGSYLSNTSRCFDSLDGIVTQDSDCKVKGICAAVRCDFAWQVYQVKFSEAANWTFCQAGKSVEPGNFNRNIISGRVTCPPFESVCGLTELRSEPLDYHWSAFPPEDGDPGNNTDTDEDDPEDSGPNSTDPGPVISPVDLAENRCEGGWLASRWRHPGFLSQAVLALVILAVLWH